MEMRMKETNPKVEKVEPGGQKDPPPLSSPTTQKGLSHESFKARILFVFPQSTSGLRHLVHI
jgi:hypothetical protein